MAQEPETFELKEPTPIPTVFVTGIKVATEESHVMVMGWANFPEVKERRVVVRFAMTKTAAADLLAQLSQKI